MVSSLLSAVVSAVLWAPAAHAAALDDGVHATLAAPAGWVVARTEDRVEIASKAMPGTGLTAWRGVTVLDPGVTSEAFLAVIADTRRHVDMSDDLVESVPVRAEQGGQLYYQVLDLPAPLSDRYWICYSTTSRDLGSPGRHLRRWSSADPDEGTDVRATLQERYGRAVEVTHTHGQWLLEPQPDGRLKVTLRSVVDPGGALPTALAGTIAGRGVAENIRRMEAAARAK